MDGVITDNLGEETLGGRINMGITQLFLETYRKIAGVNVDEVQGVWMGGNVVSCFAECA